MRAAKIFILLTPTHSTDSNAEEGRSALGLFAKYSGREVDGVTQAVELLYCSDHGKKMQTVDGNLQPDPKKAIVLQDGDKIGIYMVGHKQDYDTNKPAKLIKTFLKERIAKAPKVVETTDEKKKKPRSIQVTLDKVCLVLCDSAERLTKTRVTKTKDQPIVVQQANESNAAFKKRLNQDVKQYGLETSLLAELCRRLAEEGYYPRLAGYVGAITAVGPIDIDKETGLSNKGFFPKELKVGQKTPGFDKDAAKLYFVYEPGTGYIQRDFASWTDKP